jgi:hypothetical protein
MPLPRHPKWKVPAATFFFSCIHSHLLYLDSLSFRSRFPNFWVALLASLACPYRPLPTMSHAEKDVQDVNAESQFQKPEDLVERDEDTGVMQMESLCMNCHKSVGHSTTPKL